MKPFVLTPFRSALAITVTAGLCTSMLVATPALAAESAQPPSSSVTTDSDELRASQLGTELHLIEEIPDSVLLAGDEALAQWMAENDPIAGLAAPRADLFGCAGAIAWLIASTAIPAAKILKIKRLIETLGGAVKAVKIFWEHSFKWEKIKALGGTAAALGAELLGISAVQQKCFS